NRLAPCAAAGALFWAIHPLRAETLGWASGLLYALACAFALLGVLAYCRAQTASPRAESRAWRALALLLYPISLLTYPITLGVVAVFLAVDVLGWRRPPRAAAGAVRSPVVRLALRNLPFLLAAAAVTGVTLFSR